jgi:hypothetical protein
MVLVYLFKLLHVWLLKIVKDLTQRITTAVASVNEDMLRCVLKELDYRVDICRVTKISHVEHQLLSHINLEACTKNMYFGYINNILVSLKR